MEFDPRVIKIGIEVNGKLNVYQDLAIVVSGTKYANANQNECEVKISNLDKATQDYILTETSPFNLNKTPKLLTVEAGRKSYGTTRIFSGDITSSNGSQPPDITVTLKSLTKNFSKGDVVSRNQPAQSKLSSISQQVAGDLNLSLNFQAKDKSIGNYAYNGGNLKQVDALGEAGDVDVYVDDGVLVVKDARVPLSNTVRILNIDSGMVGVPEMTEHGIKVKFLLDNQTVLGGGLRIQSKINPAANGDYTIYKLGFEIANRDTPFYWIAEAIR